MPILHQARERFEAMVRTERLDSAEVLVTAKGLTPKEAIGTPARRDYPIIKGKEKMIEATCLGAKGQAFTDAPGDFSGPLSEVLLLPLEDNRNRAIFVATLNAVLSHLRITEGTVHCKDREPEKCAEEIAAYLKETYGTISIGLIGLNPAIAEKLIEVFGADRVHITDRDKDNVGDDRFGVNVWDGDNDTEDLIRASDVLLITGTTLTNGTFDDIRTCVEAHNKKHLFFGVTGSGIASLFGLNRICPCGHAG